MSDLNYTCRCGGMSAKIEGVTPSKVIMRTVCYCHDCQAYARHLGQEDDILDERGGTRIFQVPPKLVTFERGAEHLAAVRFSDNGPVRWYAACCRSPMGNTLVTRAVAFVGMTERKGQFSREDGERLGPLKTCVFADDAKGGHDPALKKANLLLMLPPMLLKLAGAYLSGDHKQTPFFDENGAPVVEPEIMATDDRDALLAEVKGV